MSDIQNELKAHQNQHEVAWETIELDYAQSWVLAGLSQKKDAQNILIFKGGTCLKKCYFGDYRFSEDLDFSANTKIDDETLDQHIDDICQKATEIAKLQNLVLKIERELYLEKKTHPHNQRAYTIQVQYPWHRKPLTKIKFEVSRDEKLVFKPVTRELINNYDEKIEGQVNTYSLEEVLLEKYRAILQNQERLAKKKWIRSRVRDFYDLWHVFHQYREHLHLEGFSSSFVEKCQIKDINFKGPGQFFDNEAYLEKVKKDWKQYLGKLVADLPVFDETMAGLKRITYEIF